MSSLIHIIYNSAASCDFAEADLDRLLQHSRQANAAAGITGILIHAEHTFFQVLEGPEQAVSDTYGRIGGDPRHCRITRIIREPIARRAFGEWTMGYARMTRREIAAIDGFNDFFESASCLERMPVGRASKLLRRFEQGRWRCNAPRDPQRMMAEQHSA